MDMSRYAPRGTVLEDFLNGLVKGIFFVLTSLTPAMIMAFSILHIFNITGLLQIIGNFFNPIMGLFGLPGETGVALITGWLNTPAGLSLCINFYANGIINASQFAIMIPIMWACGSCLQMTGRILAVCKLEKKYYFPVYIVSWLTAFIVGILGRICNSLFFS